MKIGYLLQQEVDIRTPPYDGPATHVREVVKELVLQGHEVQVLFRLDNRLWKSTNLVDYETITVPRMDRGPLRLLERAIRRLQYELQLPYAAFFESMRFALGCRQALRGCDLFLERMTWVSYGGALAARWLNKPLVLENNGDPLFDLEAKGIAPRGIQRHLSFYLMKRAVLSASHIVVSGDGWREQFIKRWGVDPAVTTTVENGTSLVDLLSREQLRSFQDEKDPDAPITLVYLGGFQPWQGVPALIRALSRVVTHGANARLLLIGSGAGMEDARRLAVETGVDDRVTFAGRLPPDTYAPLLAGADIGVAPYCGWPEFSGLKLFDYKAAGLPAIVSGRDGQPATVRHGESGWIVPPCDEAALAEAIVQLSSHSALRREMGRRARVEAESAHTWRHTALRLEGLFAQLVGDAGVDDSTAGWDASRSIAR